jgi:HMG-box domain
MYFSIYINFRLFLQLPKDMSIECVRNQLYFARSMIHPAQLFLNQSDAAMYPTLVCDLHLRMTERTMQNKKTHPTSKKWSWRKPKGKPKRPLSAYNIFYQEVRQEILEERNGSQEAGMGGIGFRNLTRAVAEKWKDLDSTLKRPYELKAREAKAQYLVDLALWEKSRQKLAGMDSQSASPTSPSLKPHEGCESSNIPSLVSALYDASHNSSSFEESKVSSCRWITSSSNRPMPPNPFLSNEPAIDAILTSACDMYSEYGLRSDHALLQQHFESNGKLEPTARHFPMHARFSNAWHDGEGNYPGERYRLSSYGNDIYEPLPLHSGTEFSRLVIRNSECTGSATTGMEGRATYLEIIPEERMDAAGCTALDKLLNMLDNDDSFS